MWKHRVKMNNFSISTQNLALSLRKASSSAASYGVSLDNVIGYTTAIIFLSPYIEIYK